MSGGAVKEVRNNEIQPGDASGQHGDGQHDPAGASHETSTARHGARHARLSAPQSGPASEALNTALTWARDHPLLCAATVAAVAAIGPGRLARRMISGGTVLAAMALRNPQNVSRITRLLSKAAGYTRRARNRYPP